MKRGAIATSLCSATGIQLALAVQAGTEQAAIATALLAGGAGAIAALAVARHRLGGMPLRVCVLVASYAFLFAFTMPVTFGGDEPGEAAGMHHQHGGQHHAMDP